MAINDSNTAGDGKFWLNMTAESIYNAPNKIENSVSNLAKLILWTFGLFFAGTGSLITIFGGIHDFDKYALIVFGLAFFFLCLSYFLANRALNPVAKSLRPTELEAIKRAYSETVQKQTERFSWASGFTSIGFFLLAIGIYLQFWSVSKNRNEKVQSIYYMDAHAEKSGGKIFIPVTIMGKKKQIIKLSFLDCESLDSISNNKQMVLFNSVFTTDTLGNLYFSYPVISDSIKTMIVKAVFVEKVTGDSLEEKSKSIKLTLKK